MTPRLKLGVGRRAIQTKARHGRAPALQPRPGGGRSSPKQRLVGRPSSRACAANQPGEQLHAHARIDMANTCKGAPTAESQGGMPDYFPIWNIAQHALAHSQKLVRFGVQCKRSSSPLENQSLHTPNNRIPTTIPWHQPRGTCKHAEHHAG